MNKQIEIVKLQDYKIEWVIPKIRIKLSRKELKPCTKQ